MIGYSCLFPGQGCQYEGMLDELVETIPDGIEIMKEANAILGYSLLEVNRRHDLIHNTKYSQPLLFVYSYIAYCALTANKVIPDYIAGHSLGELTALACSGVLTFQDAVYLVKQRAQLMSERISVSGGMLAVMDVDVGTIVAICERFSDKENYVAVSNYNSDSQVILSGKDTVIEIVRDYLNSMGVVTIPLKVSAPFHTNYMQEANTAFCNCLDKIQFSDAKIPIVSSLDANINRDKETIKEKFRRQMYSPVVWKNTIDIVESQGVQKHIEISPKPVLVNLMGTATLKCLVTARDGQEIIEFLDQYTADYCTDILSRILGVLVSTPNGCEDIDEYNENVIHPYRRIEAIRNQYEKQEMSGKEGLYTAVEFMKEILKTKKSPEFRINKKAEEFLFEINKIGGKCYEESQNTSGLYK